MIVNLTSQVGNEYRKVTKEEFKKLLTLEQKYGYLDAVPKKEYKFVDKILQRIEVEIYEIVRYV